MVRDAMLSVAGVLDARLGGPSFFDHSSAQGTGHGGDSLQEHRSRRAGNESADAVPGLAARRPKPLARRLRLPRSVDLGTAAGRHDHAAPGAVDDE